MGSDEKNQDSMLDPRPSEWDELRRQGHAMLDDMFDYIQNIRERPVWQTPPAEKRALFSEALPREGGSLDDAYAMFKDSILPYSVGNVHPGFMGWVHGAGTPVGMLSEMLAAGLNANVGGRDHMPVEVERQIVRWMRELFDFPQEASGVFVTGSSMANFIGVQVARYRAGGSAVRRQGVRQAAGSELLAYTSVAAHGCVARAMDLAGLGSSNLRKIPVSADGGIDLNALRRAIQTDRAAGAQPFLIVGTAGSVDTGAIDDLDALGRIARELNIHFHVDGAYGAMAALSPELKPRLRGIELADSIAMDFHKWLHVPYDAGFVLVRDGSLHLETFVEDPQSYLARNQRGMAAGSPWPCDLGPDLSRGFRALKTWFTFKVYGATRLGQSIERSCTLARAMGAAITELPQLELLAPVSLNIVCFRHRGGAGMSAEQVDALNQQLLLEIQESGIAAPSSTKIGGRFAIRAALFNHRTTQQDIDRMLAFALQAAADKLTPQAPSAAVAAVAVHQENIMSQTPSLPRFVPGSKYQIGLEPLLHAAFFGVDLKPLGNELIAYLADHPNDANALMDLSYVLQINGHEAVAAGTQLEAIGIKRHFHLPTATEGTPRLRLLALVAPGNFMANVPLEFLLSGASIALDTLYVTRDQPVPAVLPPHDVLFAAMGESDETQDILHQLSDAASGWSKPLLNHPMHSLSLSRDVVSILTQDIETVSMPFTARLRRHELEGIQNGDPLNDFLSDGEWPLIVRPLTSHAGHGLEKLNGPQDIAPYLASQPGVQQFFISRFIDYSSADGQFRKYRIVLIKGEPFLCHMAISSHWMIHYLNAGMTESEAKRKEEERVMLSFDQDFAVRHAEAFAGLYDTFPLDYFGMDCAETRDGKLLIFEVDTGMIVHAMDPDDLFPYKAAAMQKVFKAFQNMLFDAAGIARPADELPHA
ncbi:pyridoxal-dependent decarboxylase [Herbaspirillum lusitanum]|uniref:Pyridoxal-dependent decarboxylase n=1 Tax=Herbaspirillum lusitanum TaxID=213312 RepID=A0ABW9A5Q8_9BURK